MQSRWFRRIRQIMEWSHVARACLPFAFLLALYAAYLVWAQVMLRVDGGTRVINVDTYHAFLPVVTAIVTGGVLLLGLGLWLRRRQPDALWFQHVSALYYGLSLVYGGYMTGSLNIATGAVLMGAPIVGFLLLERGPVLIGITVAFLAVLGLNIASAWGDLPYSPLLHAPTDQRTAFLWVSSQLAFVAPFMASALSQVATLVSYWREREARVLALSLTDALTGVPNRRHALEILTRELARAQRQAEPLAVVLLDLDHFKKINDTWGHPAGDRVLQASAQALQECIRPGDALGRFGGEEFVLVLPAAGPEEASIVVQRCRAALAALEVRADTGEPVPVRGSFGLAWVEAGDVTTPETLLRSADEALYRAKDSGRNRLVVASAPCRGGRVHAEAPCATGPDWREMRSLADARRLLAGLIEWSPAAKTGFLLGFLLLMGANYWLYLTYMLSRPDRAAMIDTNVAEALLAMTPPVLGVAVLILATGQYLSRRRPDAVWVQYATLSFFGATLITVGYTMGMLNMPTGAILLCSALLGFILFERAIVMKVFVPCLLAVFGLAYASAFGWLPYAPMLARDLPVWQMATPFSVLTNYFFICWAVPIMLVTTDHVLGHWRAREAEVQALSLTDALTGVGNRRSILDELARELRQAERSGATLAVVLVDLDHFKAINDTWGHATGDAVLQATAKALRTTLRQSDAIGRYGGEEFMLLLRDTDRDGAVALLERCRETLERISVQSDSGERVRVSGSFGVACVTVSAASDADTLVRAADEALYRAKAGGRNRVEAADLAHCA